MSFEKLGLSENTLHAIRRKGFDSPTHIQREVIPRLLNGDGHLIGQSQTGTGKTASFALPLIEKIEEDMGLQAIILTPTRELAVQVAEEIKSLRGRKRIRVATVYGGVSIGPQIRAIESAHVVVGTPGRVLDHLERGTLRLEGIDYFILDEADRMLDMGFIDDIERIMRHTGEDKRVLMFSATVPREILRLARRYLGDYELVKTTREMLAPETLEQEYYEVPHSKRFNLLTKIIDEEDFYGIVFCQTKRETRELAEKLYRKGYRAAALNGDMPQRARERTLQRFREGRVRVLVATDVAARGIDVKNTTHVLNYSIPQNPEAYVHRIGRTGRAGRKGKAITFIMPGEGRRIRYISNIAGVRIEKRKTPPLRPSY
ncbi:DEAD/DEAH box helicase [Palaeococcus ferrophilus]|uniref:DEAD/DEAH box helicase n=1 Tax=Palaeococcus ferrophilus TaxID=83868 RepID=UPI00064ED28C|nr:DEAD/DEAH box helicase [Palaeococcus ferrophilus]